jgi:hypothetical protein
VIWRSDLIVSGQNFIIPVIFASFPVIFLIFRPFCAVFRSNFRFIGHFPSFTGR